jgi:hypothetical protein
MSPIQSSHAIKSFSRDQLASFVKENLGELIEDEVLAILDNHYATPAICQAIAQNPRLAGYYSVRLRLVEHKHTAQAHAVKMIHYLHWRDLLRLSLDVTIHAPVRRAIDTMLENRVDKLTIGEKIASAKRCSAPLIKIFLFDRDPRVFEALLVNQRVREDDLLLLVNSGRASVEQLQLLAKDHKWSYRYTIRKALVMNTATPRAIAASQLRFLTRRDLRDIYDNPQTSTYLRRCIERLEGSAEMA